MLVFANRFSGCIYAFVAIVSIGAATAVSMAGLPWGETTDTVLVALIQAALAVVFGLFAYSSFTWAEETPLPISVLTFMVLAALATLMLSP